MRYGIACLTQVRSPCTMLHMTQEAAPDRALLTTAETARRLGVHEVTVRRWADNGDIPVAYRTPGGRRRFHASDVEAMLSPAPTRSAS